jgi:hypothetical protein
VFCVHHGQIVFVFGLIVLVFGLKKSPIWLCFDIAAAENYDFQRED